jgi:flagellar motor switch protein FliG
MSTTTATELSGARKAAILLMSLGTDRAATMLRRLTEPEIEEILREIADLDNVDGEVIDEVVADFASAASNKSSLTHGGAEVARQLLVAVMGSDRALQLAQTLPEVSNQLPFEYLHRVQPRLAATFLTDEHPQTIALVLSNLPAGLAAQLLAEMPADFRREVAVRIATLDRTSPDVVGLIDEHLADRFSTILVDDQREIGGIGALVDLLTRSDDETEKAVVDGLAEVDENLAERVRAALFSFDDIVALPDRAVQQVLRGVDTKDLALALKGAGETIREKLLGNLSSRAGETLREEIELLGRVRMSAVEEARNNVLRTVRELEQQGQIVLERSSDDFVD